MYSVIFQIFIHPHVIYVQSHPIYIQSDLIHIQSHFIFSRFTPYYLISLFIFRLMMLHAV